MKRWSRQVVALVVLIGLVSVGAGSAFIGIGADKYLFLRAAMEEEQITLGVNDSQLAKGEVVDTMDEAQIAGDIVRSHRHEIAPTYGDLLGDERYDPTDPQQLLYAQAMNIENYLYLAAASYGITYFAMGTGGVMIAIGIALLVLALFLRAWSRDAATEGVESGSSTAGRSKTPAGT